MLFCQLVSISQRARDVALLKAPIKAPIKIALVLFFYSSTALSMMDPESCSSEQLDISTDSAIANIHAQISGDLTLTEEGFKLLLPSIYVEMKRQEKKHWFSSDEEKIPAMKKDEFNSLTGAWSFLGEKNNMKELDTEKLHELYRKFITWKTPEEAAEGVFTLFQENGGNYYSRFYSSIIWCYYLCTAWKNQHRKLSDADSHHKTKELVDKALVNFTAIVDAFETALTGYDPSRTVFVDSTLKSGCKHSNPFLTLPEILCAISPVYPCPIFQGLSWKGERLSYKVEKLNLEGEKSTLTFSGFLKKSLFILLETYEMKKISHEVYQEEPAFLNLFLSEHDKTGIIYEHMKLAANDDPVIASAHLMYNYPIALWSDEIKTLEKRVADRNYKEATLDDPLPEHIVDYLTTCLAEASRVVSTIDHFMHFYLVEHSNILKSEQEDLKKTISAKANGKLYEKAKLFFEWIEENEKARVSFRKASAVLIKIKRRDLDKYIKTEYPNLFPDAK